MPLILPGQFLDSPEIPPKIFLQQFSKTLGAAEHTATRHNTAAARQPPLKTPSSSKKEKRILDPLRYCLLAAGGPVQHS
jgi:hypothetical protein